MQIKKKFSGRETVSQLPEHLEKLGRNFAYLRNTNNGGGIEKRKTPKKLRGGYCAGAWLVDKKKVGTVGGFRPRSYPKGEGRKKAICLDLINKEMRGGNWRAGGPTDTRTQ